MATHDYIVDNQNGANFRSDLNNALAAIVSNNSSATAPTTTYAFMLWADTASDLLKQRNAADSAWINILTLSTGAPLATIANFTSTGIDDNATSTAITIDSSENVGIGTSSPTEHLHIESSTASPTLLIKAAGQTGSTAPTAEIILANGSLSSNDSAPKITAYRVGDYSSTPLRSSGLRFQTTNANAAVTAMTITNDGRGLSQFTAKAWVNFNGTGTVAIRDSHNVSSITDASTGAHTVNFTNAMANASYSVATCNGDDRMTTTLHNTLVATGSFRLHSKSNANAFADSMIVMAQVFGD